MDAGAGFPVPQHDWITYNHAWRHRGSLGSECQGFLGFRADQHITLPLPTRCSTPRVLLLEEPKAHRRSNGSRAVAGTEAIEDLLTVSLHCAFGDPKLVGNLRVGQPIL